jgi:hypothetical protein
MSRSTLVGTGFLLCCLSLSAQVAQDATSAVQDSAVTNQSQDNQAANTASEGPLSRWLEVNALSFTMRYRNSFDTDGGKVFDNIQQRNLIAGKLKLDKEGKYFVGFRAESGRYFNWSYGNFSGLDYKTALYANFYNTSPQHIGVVLSAYYADPIGAEVLQHLVARGWEFYVRDLYLSATPVKWLTLQFGAIPIERGVSSEITTFDDDGYISGERAILHDAKLLHADKIEFTSAYLGDVYTPNFFDRYDRLAQSNYRQVLGEKHFGSRVKASADYTWLIGTNTLHEGVWAKTSESKVLDSARFELYQRTNTVTLPGYVGKAGDGLAFTGSKKFSKRVTVEAGYASVDNYSGIYTGNSTLASSGFAINGDSYGIGQRFFERANVKVVPGMSMFGFYTHEINSKATPLEFSYTRQNYNFGMEFNFKEMLQRAGLL